MIYIFNIHKSGRYNEYLIEYFLENFLKYRVNFRRKKVQMFFFSVAWIHYVITGMWLIGCEYYFAFLRTWVN